MKTAIVPSSLFAARSALALSALSAGAATTTITVPAGMSLSIDEAFSAGYVSGSANYAELCAAADLQVSGAGRLVVNKDLKSDGLAGEIHVNAGATLRLTVSGALGDTAHGTFVADGATLETLASGGASSLDSVLYASWDTPPQIEEGNTEGGGLASRHVPIVQLVYNGIWLQNPFTLNQGRVRHLASLRATPSSWRMSPVPGAFSMYGSRTTRASIAS